MESTLLCDCHIGTHVDAPAHALPGGATSESLPLDLLIGDAMVAHVPDAHAITPNALESLNVPPGTRRLLLRTRNSLLWGKAFQTDYAALTPDAAQWVVERGIRLLGVDYLSVQRYDERGFKTHRILLSGGVTVVEGLDLSQVEAGVYELLCLPLKLTDAGGVPARAVLRRYSSSDRDTRQR